MENELIPSFPVPADAPAYTHQSIYIDARPEQVWAVLTDIAAWPRWQPGVTRMDMQGPLQAGTEFVWKAGFVIHSRLEVVKPPHHIAWTGRTFGTRARHAWRLSPQGEGTLVETEESFEGWLPALLPGMIRKTLTEAIAKGLQELKAGI